MSAISNYISNYDNIEYLSKIEWRHSTYRRKPKDALPDIENMILDQSQTVFNTGTGINTSSTIYPWQSFTAGITGELVHLEAGFFNDINGTGNLRIYQGQGTHGPLLYSATVSVFSNLPNMLSVSPWSVSVPVTAGVQYTFLLIPLTGFPVGGGVAAGTINGGAGDLYSGGTLGTYNNGANGIFHNVDWAFRTFVRPIGVLFTNDGNDVDFNTLNPADYTLPVADALGGDDKVILPSDGGGTIAWGLQGGFHGGAGNDTITAGSFGMLLYGDDGNDTIHGSTDGDSIDGGAGNDRLYHTHSGGDDNAGDTLIGGSGTDVFVIGSDDTVQDAQAGEVIGLDGALDGELFFITSRDDGGGYRIIRLERDGSSFIEVASARIVSTSPLRFNFAETVDGVELSVENGANDPASAFHEAVGTDAGNAILAKAEALGQVIAQEILKFLGAEAEGKAVEGMAALAAHLGRQAPLKLTFQLLDGVGTKVLEVGELIGGLTGFWINKFSGRYETQAEENEAFRDALSPLIDPLILAIRIGKAAFELEEAISDLFVQKAIDAVSAFIDTMTDGVLSVADAEGRIVGTDGNDVLIGHGDGNVLIGGGGDDTIVGSPGEDRVDYRSSTAGVFVDLAAGLASSNPNPPSQNAANDQLPGASIGTDSLSGIETIIGSEFDDILKGDSEANRFEGRSGDDLYHVDNGDVVVEQSGGGNDRVVASVSYALGDDAEVETLEAAAGSAPINLTGNWLTQTLIGTAGVNILIGGGGADILAGGAGNDIYRVEEAGDVVLESAGGGSDSVYAVTSYALAAGSEVELLSAIDPSATTAMNLTGNEFANLLYGNAFANVLIGGGGSDILAGGAGNDIYRVEEAGDVVLESVGGGSDSVYAVISYALGVGSEIELLSAIDPGSTAAMDLTGNDYGNTLIGTAGANVLIGGGGNDALSGGLGNDIYRVEDAGDVVFEGAGGGADSVYAVVSYTLGAGSQVELLSAIDPASTGAMNLTGNEFSNTIIGTAGTNTLIGGGAVDVLAGGAGNDFYRVEEAGDVVFEGAGGGSDSVYAVTGYALGAGSQVETLSAIDPASTGAMNLTGNEFAQAIYGTAGANLLNGLGGADSLWGFAGADSFAFTAALGGGNVDTIVDFVSATDKIALDDALFGGIGSPGAFSAAAFFAGTAAHDTDDRIIYDGATGQLFYDADGTGAVAAIHFATLLGAPALAASDFQVI